jgi:hypothetical protein
VRDEQLHDLGKVVDDHRQGLRHRLHVAGEENVLGRDVELTPFGQRLAEKGVESCVNGVESGRGAL